MPGTMILKLKGLLAAAAFLALGGCYTADTPILTAENGERHPTLSEGVYCHAENRLLPPTVSVSPQISEALGANKCRDISFDSAEGRYVDARSSSTVMRYAPFADLPLGILQYQTGRTAPARYLPVAAVEGMVLAYDGQGTWPGDLVADLGLTLSDDGTLTGASPKQVRALLYALNKRLIETVRADVAFVEDADGPRLEFRNIDASYRYLVHFREDWSGDTEKMRGAMLALTELLGLSRHTEMWTEARPD